MKQKTELTWKNRPQAVLLHATTEQDNSSDATHDKYRRIQSRARLGARPPLHVLGWGHCPARHPHVNGADGVRTNLAGAFDPHGIDGRS